MGLGLGLGLARAWEAFASLEVSDAATAMLSAAPVARIVAVIRTLLAATITSTRDSSTAAAAAMLVRMAAMLVAS